MKTISTPLASLCVLFGGFLCAPSPLLAAPPPNDNFSDAAPLAFDTLTVVNNVEATIEPGETGHRKFGTPALKSVWYRLTPDFNGYVEVDTAGSVGDTVLAIYRGSSLAKAIRLGQSDDTTLNTRAKLRFAVTKGVSYAIALDTFTGAGSQQIIARALLRLQRGTFEAETRFTSSFTSPYKEDHGKLTLVLTDKGGVSGRVFAGKTSYPFKSAISTDKVIPIIIARPQQLPIFLTVTLDTLATGQIRPVAALAGNMGDQALTATTAFQAPQFSTFNPCPRSGSYNHSIGNLLNISGRGIGRLSISRTGICKGSGWMGDGTPFTFATRLLNDGGGDSALDLLGKGRLIYHVPRYAGKGQIGGRIALNRVSDSSTTLSGSTYWFRPPSSGPFLPLGIEQYTLAIIGHNYAPPTTPATRLDVAFNANGGSAGFSASSIGLTTITQNVTLGTGNVLVVTGSNPNRVTLKLNVKTGIVTGSAKFDEQPKASILRAILIPTGNGIDLPGFYGYNLTPERGSLVTILSN